MMILFPLGSGIRLWSLMSSLLHKQMQPWDAGLRKMLLPQVVGLQLGPIVPWMKIPLPSNSLMWSWNGPNALPPNTVLLHGVSAAEPYSFETWSFSQRVAVKVPVGVT
jgi:hypothetical protein